MRTAQRFEMALDIACAAIAVLFSDRIATEMEGAAAAQSAAPVIAQVPRLRGFTALYDEFRDVIWGRKFGTRLKDAAFPDLRSPRYYEISYEAERRLAILLRLTHMPSEIAKALFEASGWDAQSPGSRGSSEAVRAVASDLGCERASVSYCSRANVDLDAQWQALRSELLRMRAESGAAR